MSDERTLLTEMVDLDGIQDPAARRGIQKALRAIDINRGGDERRDEDLTALRERMGDLEEWRAAHVKRHAEVANLVRAWVKWGVGTALTVAGLIWSVLEFLL